MLKLETRQTLFWSACAVVLLMLLWSLSPILMPFVTALILAYVLNPGVDWMQRKRIPRAAGSLLMMVGLALAMLLLALLIIAVLQREIPALREQVPGMIAKINAFITPRLADLGVKVKLDMPAVTRMLTERFADSPDDVLRRLLATARVSGNAALSVIGNLVFIPLALFFLLLDWPAMIRNVKNAIPNRWRAKVLEIAGETDELLSQYLRGQLLVMLILAIYYSTALAIAGFEIALPVGVFTGLAVFIPYVGFGIGLALALMAALLQFGSLYGFIAVGVIYGLGQVVESFFLTPRLVGERIGMPPLAVIFALLAFGQWFGFVGILLALPASAILMVLLRHLRRLYLDSAFYRI